MEIFRSHKVSGEIKRQTEALLNCFIHLSASIVMSTGLLGLMRPTFIEQRLVTVFEIRKIQMNSCSWSHVHKCSGQHSRCMWKSERSYIIVFAGMANNEILFKVITPYSSCTLPDEFYLTYMSEFHKIWAHVFIS